ncbi:IS630 family transposase, partial [Paenibacillus sp. MER TA 81-3]|nr:IS630 family transposase [Paenibacillus sp. MER TA 81-3]
PRHLQSDGTLRTQLYKTDIHACGSRSREATPVCRIDLSRFEKKLLNHEIDHLLFEDESMIRDYQAIQKTWFLRGKQR